MDFAMLVGRARNEFLEMPDLQLTMAQAARLWGLDMQACQAVVDALVAIEFLRWTSRFTIVRV